MGIFLYQIGIFIAIQLSTFYGGKNARNVAVILISIFTILQVFTSQLMILQFLTIIISFLVSRSILGKSNGKVIDTVIEESDNFLRGNYNNESSNLKKRENEKKNETENLDNINLSSNDSKASNFEEELREILERVYPKSENIEHTQNDESLIAKREINEKKTLSIKKKKRKNLGRKY